MTLVHVSDRITGCIERDRRGGFEPSAFLLNYLLSLLFHVLDNGMYGFSHPLVLATCWPWKRVAY